MATIALLGHEHRASRVRIARPRAAVGENRPRAGTDQNQYESASWTHVTLSARAVLMSGFGAARRWAMAMHFPIQ
jgi:hypothetical protein